MGRYSGRSTRWNSEMLSWVTVAERSTRIVIVPSLGMTVRRCVARSDRGTSMPWGRKSTVRSGTCTCASCALGENTSLTSGATVSRGVRKSRSKEVSPWE